MSREPLDALHQRIVASFSAQSMMMTLGARVVHVADGEVRVEFAHSYRFTQQRGFVHAGAITSIVDSACGYAAMTKVQNAGKSLTVCTGEVRAFASGAEDYKVVAIMQATIATLHPR